MLKGYQKQFLKKEAHDLNPAVSIGKEGFTDNMVKAVKEALDASELIKVKIVVGKEIKKKVAEQIAEKTDSEIISLIGFNVILYKENPEKEDKIILPQK